MERGICPIAEWPTVSFFNVHVWNFLISTFSPESDGRNGQDGQPASCAKFRGDWSNCCRDMAIFLFLQDGGGRHLQFLKFEIFNGPARQEGRIASLCQTSWRSVKLLPRYGNFSIFPRWRLSAILDLWCACLDHPQRVFGCLYHCAKCG